MHYPWWHVPILTSPMLIAAIAVIHVLISHYAVGGGLFLAVEARYAHREGRSDYLAYLKRHAKFFILFTVVLGAVTGVGIWWTIGLASPLATEMLIRTFVFGWAMEYVFFVLELVAGFLFYYYWDRLPPKLHVTMGAIYGLSAWISLVLITGITGFMQAPGAWLEKQDSFWVAFFNPQFLPQVLSRTGGALLLSSLYVYLHASLVAKESGLCHLIEQRSTRPALLGAVLITLGGILWFAMLPDSARAILEGAAPLNILAALLFALTVVVFFLLYFGPLRNPGWLSPGFAGALLLFGFAAFSTGEFIREAVRKPYIIYNVVLSNQIYVDQVPTQPIDEREVGYLEMGRWTSQFVRLEYPQATDGTRIDESQLLELPQSDRVRLGEVLFQYHCNDCHAEDRGYSAVAPLLRGHTRAMILDTVVHLERAHFFMPPWAGTREEAELITDYLTRIAPPRPSGMLPEVAEKEAR